MVASAALIAMARGHDQEIVRYYAVSVFAGFLGATLGCARLSHRDGRRAELAVNLAGVALVAFVLALNVVRPAGVIVLSVAGLLAGYLYAVWVRRGRPSGVAEARAACGVFGAGSTLARLTEASAITSRSPTR